jgi:PAS domain S-box-containing protein
MTSKYELLAGIASDWWWETDPELRFSFVSSRFTEVFGLPASSIIGNLRTDLARTDYDSPKWSNHLDDLAARRPFRDFESTFVDARGVSRPVAISGVPLFLGDDFQGYIGIGRDLTAQHASEREAQEHARHLEAIIENIEQGVILLDRDLRVVTFNRRLELFLEGDRFDAMHGRSIEDVMNELAKRGEYVGELEQEAVASRMALLRSAAPFSVERRRHDGRVLAVAYRPVTSGGGVMTYADVTEARDREERLRRSEENFRSSFRASPLPKWIYAADDMRFLEVNDAAIERYGYTRDEFLAMTIKDIRPAEDIPQLLAFRRLPASERAHAVGVRHRHKDGTIAEVEVFLHDIVFDGRASRQAVVIDVSERQRSARQVQRVFDTSQDVILISDDQGRFIQVSPSATRALGYMPEEMVGRNAAEFIYPADLDATRAEMRATRRGRATRNFRCRFLHQDGRVVPLVWTAVWSEPDRSHYFIGRDMTEYERTEELLRQSQKMETVGQLTGGIAHDFNNMLMIMMASVETIEETESLSADNQLRLKQVIETIDRAATLTRQLMAYSRKQTLRPQRTNINDLVAATCKLLGRTLGERVRIRLQLDPDPWFAEVDRAQLESCLVNLGINARDAMPEGGTLLFETGKATFDEDYARFRTDVLAGDYVQISVTDTGTGMPPDVLAKVFEPFFTTKEPGKGTGLGLSMVQGFIKQSKGHVYSEVGTGTSFKLFVPRSTGESVMENEASRPIRPGDGELILVVENDESVRGRVVDLLRDLGYRPVEAHDARSALAILGHAPEPYDAVLTDIVIPGELDGWSLAERISASWPRTKILFMSGFPGSIHPVTAWLNRGAQFLSKPFRRNDLARAMSDALARGTCRP